MLQTCDFSSSPSLSQLSQPPPRHVSHTHNTHYSVSISELQVRPVKTTQLWEPPSRMVFLALPMRVMRSISQLPVAGQI